MAEGPEAPASMQSAVRTGTATSGDHLIWHLSSTLQPTAMLGFGGSWVGNNDVMTNEVTSHAVMTVTVGAVTF